MTSKNIILTSFVFAITLTSCEGQNNNDKSPSSKPKDNKINIPIADTSGQTMNEDIFWNFIDKSRTASGNNYQTQITSLKTILATLEPAEIIKFDNTLQVY